MLDLIKAGLLLAFASNVNAQRGGYSSGGDSSSYGGSSGSSSNGSSYDSFFSNYTVIITAHAVLATLAFGLLFPVGGIMIRLASFRGLWWIHGVFQTFAFILYIAAFALGVYMASNLQMLHLAHPIIGIVLFVLLIFQPILGFLHHVMFKKHSRRVIWSYGHIWLGRFVITLGIINGGLGLQLAQRTRFLAPPQGSIIAYSVVAGIIWVIYMASAIYGETKRRSNSAKGDITPPPQYEESRHRRGAKRGEMTQYA
ncbi:hypothetical protein LTR36_010786 [Oleoguttula mirabilis]|uniref:Cytochrome b561 domain-containing protein n=1 Tax=Oleoguttula mirabilis TaxID=1507867 RepID=A0AAV9JRI7_9PEZI|nr:hypothetical protein LTR36_010786 [Oleoguttula mirabilis]